MVLSFFKFFLVFSSFFVVFSRNPVHSVLFLILVFCNGAGILLLSGADFLALVFLVVYVGAVSVLFLFIVMMLNLKIVGFSQSIFNHYPAAIFIFALFLLEFRLFFKFLFSPPTLDYLDFGGWLSSLNYLSSIYVFGSLCYTFYFIYFLMCGLVLVVSMIGPIFLTLSRSRSSKELSNLYLSKLPVVRYFQ